MKLVKIEKVRLTLCKREVEIALINIMQPDATTLNFLPISSVEPMKFYKPIIILQTDRH